MKTNIMPLLQLITAFYVSSCAAAQMPGKKEIVIVLDPGHGGKVDVGRSSPPHHDLSRANNAWTATAYREKKTNQNILGQDTAERYLTMALSRMIRDELKQQSQNADTPIRVVMTKEKEDENPTSEVRASLAAKNQAASFVSIHFNGHPAGTALEKRNTKGTEAFVRGVSPDDTTFAAASPSSIPFAAELVKAVQSAIPTNLRRKGLNYVDGVATDFESKTSKAVGADGKLIGLGLLYHLNRQPETREIPSCILEVEYIDNSVVDDALLKDGKWKTTFPPIAKAIAERLIHWHKMNP